MRFSVFTHVEHIRTGREFFGYAPYVREMNLWFTHAEAVEIIAPITSKPVSTAEMPYRHKNLIYTDIPAFNLLSLKDTFGALLKIPGIARKIYKAMKRADHIHIRCPGNIGLLACLVQVLFPKKPKIVKYAGNWDPNAKQPWSYNFQKWILSNVFLSRNIKVLVYGEWPNRSKNIEPFFTASFSEKETPEGLNKNFNRNLTFLYVGNLVPIKNPLLAIQLVEKLRKKSFPITLELYGDGVLRAELETYCLENKLSEYIHFKGSQTLETLKEAYKKAHFLVLLSTSEGWPKAVAEAMFFGCIPIATPVSCVPWMLGASQKDREEGREEQRGITGGKQEKESKKEEIGLEKYLNKIIGLLKDSQEMHRKSLAAMEWSQQYTLEKFEIEIQEVLNMD